MSEFLTIDQKSENELPSHAADGRSGDRVSFLEAGLLYVESGRATFVRWGDVLGVVEYLSSAYVLVPRRPPRAPWIEVDVSLLGDEDKAVSTFVGRVRERVRGGGYRDAVRQRRQDLDKLALTRKIRLREPVPGALEVPSTIRLGSTAHRLEGPVLVSLIMGGAALSYALGFLGLFALDGRPAPGTEGVLMMLMGLGPYVGGLLGALAAVYIRKRWRAARDAEQPRERVLVLAPDGCLIGFRTGVKALKWAEIGAFDIGPTEPEYNDGLVVFDTDGAKLGDIDCGWLDAPLRLVVKVAQAYREAAL